MIEKKTILIINQQKMISENELRDIYFGFSFEMHQEIDSQDFKEVIDEIRNFYSSCDKINAYILSPYELIDSFKNKEFEVCKNIKDIQEMKYEKDINNLFQYSRINYKLLEKLCSLFKQVNKDLNSIKNSIDNELSKLESKGFYVDKDLRFEDRKELLENLKTSMEDIIDE